MEVKPLRSFWACASSRADTQYLPSLLTPLAAVAAWPSPACHILREELQRPMGFSRGQHLEWIPTSQKHPQSSQAPWSGPES